MSEITATPQEPAAPQYDDSGRGSYLDAWGRPPQDAFGRNIEPPTPLPGSHTVHVPKPGTRPLDDLILEPERLNPRYSEDSPLNREEFVERYASEAGDMAQVLGFTEEQLRFALDQNPVMAMEWLRHQVEGKEGTTKLHLPDGREIDVPKTQVAQTLMNVKVARSAEAAVGREFAGLTRGMDSKTVNMLYHTMMPLLMADEAGKRNLLERGDMACVRKAFADAWNRLDRSSRGALGQQRQQREQNERHDMVRGVTKDIFGGRVRREVR